MDLATELATTCVTAGFVKKAEPALSDLRDEFEALATREQGLRGHAGRLEELAKRRALDDKERSNIGTFAERMLPIPHTTGEAGFLAPAMLAGGIAGHKFGKGFEALPGQELGAVLSPEKGTLLSAAKGKAPAGTLPSFGTPLGQRLHELAQVYHGKALPEAEIHGQVKALMEKMRTAGGPAVAEATRKRHIPGLQSIPKGLESLPKDVEGAIGPGGIGTLRREAENLMTHRAGKEGLRASLKGFRLGGAAGGALLAGGAASVPLAIRALLRRRHGGEAAVIARNKEEKTNREAERLSKLREEVLAKLPKENA